MPNTNGQPTRNEQKVIDLALRDGITRAEFRKAMGYEVGQNIPVQQMMIKLAETFSYKFDTEYFTVTDDGPQFALYRFSKKGAAKKAPAKKRAVAKVSAKKMAAAKASATRRSSRKVATKKPAKKSRRS